ncbi:MAG: hypothetical protein EOO17_00990 [Chloroflexi bacterium]|nr:MAG: hypothetical protein EOO17_00990 [Chloroflexota bacterium]
MKQELNSLLAKKMDRKDFLKHIGIAIVAITGVSAIVKTLAPAPAGHTNIARSNASGYGSSVYGGAKNS